VVTPEFDCQDCGSHVYLFGGDKIPVPPRCATCDFLQQMPEEERDKAAELVFHRHPAELESWRSQQQAPE
jgi:hypothetical protein